MGRPEITATSANGLARSASKAGTPGSGRASLGSLTMAAIVPSKSKNSALGARLGRQRSQERRQARRGVARSRQRQAVVVVVEAARSEPMTTTTSIPVTPLTGVAVVMGRTWAGLTPMVVAMDAAGCCIPAA